MVETNTFISDTIIFLRDTLLNNITDPISATRPTNEKFVMTSYPQRSVTYPLITVKNNGIELPIRLGMQSEIHFTTINLEVRIWARNVKEKDNLSQNVINHLRDLQNNVGGSVTNKLYEFKIESSVDVDEDGDGGIKSRIIRMSYKILLGA